MAGETDNYINTRAVCEQREPLAVLETVVAEAIAANGRVVGLLHTRSDPVYARKWNEFFNGYVFFHVTAQRYKLHVYAGLAHGGVHGREEFGGQTPSEQPVAGLLLRQGGVREPLRFTAAVRLDCVLSVAGCKCLCWLRRKYAFGEEHLVCTVNGDTTRAH